MLTIEEILKATKGELIKGSLTPEISGVSIDSRSIKPKELFVAIKGKRFDGHDFINQAIRRGAGAIVFSNPSYAKPAFGVLRSVAMIEVSKTVEALGALAHYYRLRFKISVIAITGSNGKTTTKEMLGAILASKFKVLRNPGTENTLIGASLTILRLRKRHDLALIEIGANHAGEIDRLARILEPTVGIITNIGPSHLKFFKTLKGVFKAKFELINNLPKGAKLIINNDDRFLSQLNGLKLQRITFGLNHHADFFGEIIQQGNKEVVFLLNKRQRITLKALGRHNVYNALAACACARAFGVSYQQIKQALASFNPIPMRMQICRFKSVKIVVDCYNSNPESFAYALEFLRSYPSRGKKIAVCGDMLELGQKAESYHTSLGKRIAKHKINFLITVGKLGRKIASGAKGAGMAKETIRTCGNAFEAGRLLRKVASSGDIILVKASRGMNLEKAVKCFMSSSIR
ncbi:MAG: UDP-N-acetylmuramoyl-tripeptide--D-alanyl-D-alanine ligase [Omnitrophica bacterium]|nr:UDP-N-acetylmuramoyl-tripeptide--D-alanyl-D-alanine ligase [Candidatus Omnitrophota bacterium]